jgi:oligopeptide/dipeptide ABC transporter ATP-binding protein
LVTKLLEVKNLHTHFFTQGRVVRAVDGVSWEVEEGETLAVVGESGSGKSVTALSLMGLIPWPPGKVIEGEVWFQGRDILKLSEEEKRNIRGKEIAMIFQEPMTSLNPVLTIERQLTETLEAHQQLDKKTARERALEVMNGVGISDPVRRLGQYPHHLSGGMRQRVMIAMALICGPRLILADEPTTALDVTIQAQILALLKDLSERTGVAMVLITHNLGIVARYADRVHVMYGGRVVEKGRARDLYARPRHPYTIGLLKSVPRLDEREHKKLVPIEGHPPDLGAAQMGCRFAPRCSYAEARCLEVDPPLVEVAPGCWSACIKADALPKSAS